MINQTKINRAFQRIMEESDKICREEGVILNISPVKVDMELSSRPIQKITMDCSLSLTRIFFNFC